MGLLGKFRLLGLLGKHMLMVLLEKLWLLGTAMEASASKNAGKPWILGTATDASLSETAREVLASWDCEGSFQL